MEGHLISPTTSSLTAEISALLSHTLVCSLFSGSHSLNIPDSDLLKLYHVVFSDDFHAVSILDNNLNLVPGGEFVLLPRHDQ